jgi:hypothetical protein
MSGPDMRQLIKTTRLIAAQGEAKGVPVAYEGKYVGPNALPLVTISTADDAKDAKGHLRKSHLAIGFPHNIPFITLGDFSLKHLILKPLQFLQSLGNTFRMMVANPIRRKGPASDPVQKELQKLDPLHGQTHLVDAAAVDLLFKAQDLKQRPPHELDKELKGKLASVAFDPETGTVLENQLSDPLKSQIVLNAQKTPVGVVPKQVETAQK